MQTILQKIDGLCRMYFFHSEIFEVVLKSNPVVQNSCTPGFFLIFLVGIEKIWAFLGVEFFFLCPFFLEVNFVLVIFPQLT